VRFDPKLIQPDDAPLDPAGDIELPDDLGELAAQLCDDANFLAARFPAKLPALPAELAPVPAATKTTAAVVLAGPSRRPFWISLVAAAAILLLVISGTYRPTPQRRSEHAAQTDQSVKHVLAQDLAFPAPEQNRPAAVRTEAPRPVSPVSSPALFLNGVSGPELEGLLDLWQTDGAQDSRISI
jgi:hypothetical protein